PRQQPGGFSVRFPCGPPAPPALTVSIEPSTASIGPRTRTVCGCCANADAVASAASTAADASRRSVILCTCSSDSGCVPPARSDTHQEQTSPRTASHPRNDPVTANTDGGRRPWSIRLFGCFEDDDLGSRLKLAVVAWSVGNNRRVGRNDDFLFSVFVLDQDVLAVDAGHRRLDDRIGHGAARLQIPRAMPVGYNAF